MKLRFRWANTGVDGPFPYLMLSERACRWRPWMDRFGLHIRHYSELRGTVSWFIEWRRLWVWWES